MTRLTRLILLPLTATLLAACPGARTEPANPAAVPTGPIAAPALKPPAPLALPAINRSKLENGLGVWVLPDRSLPLVSVNLHLRAGSFDDPLDRIGLARFTSRMLRQGVQGMDADTLSETVDMAGASLGASSGGERSTISCWARSEHLELCLRLVALMAASPTFPEKEMAEVRAKLLASVKQTRDDPASLAALHFDNLLFGDGHPDGLPLSAASINRIKRADLEQFHQRFFTPDGALLGVSGDVAPARAAALAGKYFGPWPTRKRPPARTLQVKDPAPGLRVLLVDKPDLTQAFFALGHAGIPKTHPARDAARLLNHTLGGGGFSSRLMKKVRSEGGKTYGIRSGFFMAGSHGDFHVTSFTRTAELVEMLRLVRAELERIISQPPSDAEILAAKGKLAGGFPLHLQAPAALLNSLIRAELSGLGQQYITDYPVRMFGVTPAQIRAAAAKLVRPGNLVAAVVGKAAELAPLLAKEKIPFERIGYLDPISAARRAELRRQAARKVEISPAAQKKAHALLNKALRAAGGRRRLGRVRSLRLEGEATLGPIKGGYSALLLLPDLLRVSVRFRGMEMSQVLAGDQSHITAGDRRQPLPPAKQRQLCQSLFLQPALLPLRALDKGVRSRLLDPAALKLDDGQVAVELFPPGQAPAVLVLDVKSGRLLQVRSRQPDGSRLVTELSQHRKVKGVLFPYRSVSRAGSGGQQIVELKTVLINPKVSRKELIGDAPAAPAGGAAGK